MSFDTVALLAERDALRARAEKAEACYREAQRRHNEVETLRAELAAMTAERDRLREALVDACERMERARGILRKPGESEWAMLDTAALRDALAEVQS